MSSRVQDGLRSLSNTDIEILYSIILTAQNSAAPRYRALFDAYDAVLADNGIRPEYDQTYFRFLLRMGEHRNSQEISLYAQFEALLTQLGFQLDFSDEDGGSEATTDSQPHSRAAISPKQAPEHGNAPRSSAPLRRASFDSSYLTKRDRSVTDNSLSQRSPLRHSRSNSQSKTVKEPASGYSSNDNDNNAPQSTYGRTAASLGFYQEQPRRPTLILRTPTSNSVLIPSNNQSAIPDIPDIPDIPNIPELSPPSKYLKTKRERNQRAGTIVLPTNVYATPGSQSLEATASSRDRRLLLRQSFDQWLSRLHSHQHIRYDVSMLENLEAKADTARDMFLLTKAFTHWVETASYQNIRTLAVKRHVLRTRLFNAWRNLVAINDDKIRRTVLSKFLCTWKARKDSLASKVEQSLCFSDVRSIDSAYRAFFWSFCERRAPLWGAESLKARVFKKWKRSTTTAFDYVNAATRTAQLATSRKALETMHAKLMHRLHESHQAFQFRRAYLLQGYMKVIQMAVRFAPVISTLANRNKSRAMLETYVKWKAKRLSLESATLLRIQHLLARVWVTWNNRLRTRAISIMIEERLLSDALYRWVMTARLLLSRRIEDQRAKRFVINCWRLKTETLWSSLALANSNFQKGIRLRQTIHMVTHWDTLSYRLHQYQQGALAFRGRNLLRHAWQQWIGRRNDCQRMERWSSDARFYSITMKFMRHLLDTTATRKQEKRRRAYAIIRRKVKADNARAVIERWRVRAAAVQKLPSEASRFLGGLTCTNAAKYFSRWSDAMEAIVKAVSLARHRARVNLMQRAISQLLAVRDEGRNLLLRADTLLQEFLEGRVEVMFRKLNWLVFQAKLQHETAIALDDRNRKKHIRSMIKYWSERAEHLRNIPSSPSPEISRIGSRFRPIIGSIDEPISAEPASSMMQNNLLPLGYLGTPSKRTARLRARFSTPQHDPSKVQATIRGTASAGMGPTYSNTKAFGLRLKEVLQTGLDDQLQGLPLER